MSDSQDEAAQASIPEPASRSGSEQTLPDGSGGVITRTAPSVAGESYHGGTIVENDVGDSLEEMMAAIEATIKPFDEGDIVSGEIVKIDKDEVLLDIGYKSEGVIPLRELSIRNDIDPHDVVSLGDSVEALVTQKEDAEGRLMLSKKKAQYERAGAASRRSRTQTEPSKDLSSKWSRVGSYSISVCAVSCPHLWSRCDEYVTSTPMWAVRSSAESSNSTRIATTWCFLAASSSRSPRPSSARAS